MEPHLIRKVLDRDGKVLEEWDNTSFKVTNEFVAATMVDMMRAVVSGGGTASGASAGGHPLAGKTGTVNDHTDVWFIGYTPSYVTGVWMGNPERKTNLGSGMTGGHGAVPYFNSFMIPFMKDKPRDTFSSIPPMPSEMKNLIALRKREELEKLEKADAEGRKIGTIASDDKRSKTGDLEGDTIGIINPNKTPVPVDDDPPPTVTSRPRVNSSPVTKVTPKPADTPKREPVKEERKPEGTKRKGKKGDDDPGR